MTLSANKNSAQLHDQRFAMLEDIAKELDGEVVFLTCFNIAVEIGAVMKNPGASLQLIAAEVQKDPLIASKFIKLANTVTYNPSGKAILDIESAVARLGMNTARSIALACAIEQISRSKQLIPFGEMCYQWWIHSLKTAAISRVLAKRLTPRINAEVAFLAGLVHDLGAFYMLDRAANYPELVERPKSVDYLVAQWHDSIGTILLDALNLPSEIIEAARDNDQPRPTVKTLRTLSDLLYVANLFAGGLYEINKQDLPDPFEPSELLDPQFTDLKLDMDEACTQLLSVF